jgi:hypothetical protein
MDSLVADGKPDVYALTVKCIMKEQKSYMMCKAVLAMLFTFALQFGLLILLWQGLIRGSATAISDESPETEKLWHQMGQLQRQVCWLNHHAVLNTTKPPADEVDCSLAWPGGGCGQFPGWQDYQNVMKCVKQVSLIINPSFKWRQFDTYALDFNQTKLDAMLDAMPSSSECGQITILSRSLQAYAFGLAFPPTHSRPSRFENMTTMSHGGWVDEQQGLNVSSHRECMGRLLPPEGQDPSFVNLLALLALLIYAHEEVRKAVWLSYVSAACTGLLPHFYATPLSTASFATCRSALVWRFSMLLAPILQMLTALMVLISSVALTFNTETQNSTIQIIVSNVALTYILDLDNRVGAMLANQHQAAGMPHNPEDFSPTVAPAITKRKQKGRIQSIRLVVKVVSRVSTWFHLIAVKLQPVTAILGAILARAKVALGHMYMVLMGMMLLMEPLLMSRSFVAMLYLVFASKQQEHGFEVLHNDDLDQFWSRHPALLRGGDWPFLFMHIISLCTIMGFMWLFGGKMLPVTRSKRWCPVLLTTQVVLSLFTPVPVPSEMLLLFWFAGWFGMFVLWPLLHQSLPRKCSSRCSCCCHACGGCPLCSGTCPGNCCCEC